MTKLSDSSQVPIENQSDASPPAEKVDVPIVIKELDELAASFDVADIPSMGMDQLRTVRDRMNEIEAGLSYGRRMAQGRLDIVQLEQSRRSSTTVPNGPSLIDSLPDALSQNSRSNANPRHIPDIELPRFVDEITEFTDQIVSVNDLSALGDLDFSALNDLAFELSRHERSISLTRMDVHHKIDVLQEEIIARYQSGSAHVDDLLGN